MKKGSVLFELWTDDDGKIEWSEWHVRSIRKGIIYATVKAPWTWGKRSTAHGDFGWLDPISDEWRRSWRVGDEPAGQLATTRLAAIRKAVAYQKRWGSPDDYDDPGMHGRIIKRLETMLTKEQGKRARKASKAKAA